MRDIAVESSSNWRSALLIHQGSFRFIVPVEFVVETMRPLPILALEGQPSFVRGLSVIRGAATPVFDLGSIVGAAPDHAFRFISMKSEGRSLVLQVEAVLGVYRIAEKEFRALPSILRQAASNIIESLNTLDSQILMTLQPWRILSEQAWRSLEEATRTHRD